MSLRLRINLIVTLAFLAVMLAFGAQQLANSRAAVREEIEASTRVASQLLARIGAVHGQGGIQAMQQFLLRLGRVRANDIRLYDLQDRELYRSPPSTYKEGEQAPRWFEALISPDMEPSEIRLPEGRLVIEPDASRSVLDGWEAFAGQAAIGAIGVLGVNLLVWLLTGVALRPLRRVVSGLESMERGNYQVRLQPFASPEFAQIGQSFNRMAQAVQGSIEARRAEASARAELAQSRALTEVIQSRIEQERGDIARELHDEMGQHVTAIHTLCTTIARRSAASDPTSAEAARLAIDATSKIHDVIHLMIPKLRSLALDQFGLADALGDLIDQWRARNPEIRFDLRTEGIGAEGIAGSIGDEAANQGHALPERVETAAYRIVQEAVSNALRHAAARNIEIELARVTHARDARDPRDASTHAGPGLRLTVRDDGRGLPQDWQRAGHFGVLGMRERAEALGGWLAIDSGDAHGSGVTVDVSHGVTVRAWLPLPSDV